MSRILLSVAIALMAVVSCGESDGIAEISSADSSTSTTVEPAISTTVKPTSTTADSTTSTAASEPEPTTAEQPVESTAPTGDEDTGEMPDDVAAAMRNMTYVLILAATFGFEPSAEDLTCMEDSGLLTEQGSEDETMARTFSAFATCTPDQFIRGWVASAEASGVSISDDLRCFFPAAITAASKLPTEKQIEFFTADETGSVTPTHEQAAAECGFTVEDLPGLYAEVEASYTGE